MYRALRGVKPPKRTAFSMKGAADRPPVTDAIGIFSNRNLELTITLYCSDDG